MMPVRVVCPFAILLLSGKVTAVEQHDIDALLKVSVNQNEQKSIRESALSIMKTLNPFPRPKKL